MQKPKVDAIIGLSPAIAIEQRPISRNPRSTVGTVTEIYDYLRVLFARLGQPHCPNCGKPVGAMTVQPTDQQVHLVMQLPFSVFARLPAFWTLALMNGVSHPFVLPVQWLPFYCFVSIGKVRTYFFTVSYIGVGTTAVASVLHNRRAAGSDIYQQYLDIAAERIQQACEGTLRTRPLNQPVYEPTGKESISKIPDEWRE